MLKKYEILTIIVLCTICFGQSYSVPYAEFIETSKRSILPIVCIDGMNSMQGTGIQLGHEDLRFILTCEHVIAYKDSTQKTVGYFKNIFINMANHDSTTTLVRLKIDYTDEKNDFALLSIAYTQDNKKLISKITGQYIQKSVWLNDDSYSEGDYIFYTGYPMLKEITKKNYPISRTGIIAQKIENNNTFLIDGFAQHGYSGSPVFLVKDYLDRSPAIWQIKLIGITASYPSEFANVIEQVGFRGTNKKVILNPGFTNVIKMEVIIKAIEKTYNLKY